MRLADKVALVIGAASGIGRAIALRYAEEGARLAVADVVPSAGEETAALARAAGTEAVFFPVDVTERSEVTSLVDAAEARFGGLDVLVNSAGIAGRGRIEEVPAELWDRVVAVNLSGTFWACKYAVPVLLRGGGGVIINLASVAGLRGWPSSPIYSATKGAVVMLSRALAAAYARDNLRVWALCPTSVETPILERFYAQSEDPDQARRGYEAAEPMGRVITTDEVASLAVYLASNKRFAYTPEAFVV
jgi:NAD(P)-dependent dehydrogenase (short-subunit alcohol dehydrogenase family)